MKEFPIESILSVITDKMLCSQKQLKEILEYLCGVKSIHDQNFAAANSYAALVLVRQMASNGLKWLEKVDSSSFEVKAARIRQEAFLGEPDTITDARDVKVIGDGAEKAQAAMDKLIKSFVAQVTMKAKKSSFPLLTAAELNMNPFDNRYIANWWAQFRMNSN